MRSQPVGVEVRSQLRYALDMTDATSLEHWQGVKDDEVLHVFANTVGLHTECAYA